MLAALSRDYDMVNCPFCNGSRVRVNEYSARGRKARVQCLTYGCEATGPVRHDAAAAMEAWNARGGRDG